MGKQISRSNITEAVRIIHNGGVILYPTDTIYGLGCDPFNPKALKRLLALKRRAPAKGLIILVNSWSQLKRVVRPTAPELRLAQRYWPGPLTIVFDVHRGMPRLLTGGKRTLAVRWPRDRFLNTLLTNLKMPLVSTSANISGQPGSTRFSQAIRPFRSRQRQPDLTIDGGILPDRKPSTIVRRSRYGFKVIRQGDIRVHSKSQYTNHK